MRKTFKFYIPLLLPFSMQHELLKYSVWLGPIFKSGLQSAILTGSDKDYEDYKSILRKHNVDMHKTHSLNSVILN